MRARTRLPALVALFLAALTLRPQIVGAGPLIPEIQDDFGSSHALVGLIATIPVLGMGLFAPIAAILASRIGTRNGMTIAIALIAGFGVARAASPSAGVLVLLTIPVGIGMGLGNAFAPLTVKQRLPDRVAAGTGVYTTGIQIGSAAAAALAVPIAAAFGGWRYSLAAFSIIAFAVLVAWLALMGGAERHTRVSRPRFPIRSGTAWLLVAIFATLGSAYYGLNAWLPDAYIERGWSEASAGRLLAALNLSAIPASFASPWLAERYGGRQRWMQLQSIAFLAATTAIVTAPGFAYGWCLLAGVAQGGFFSLLMTVPLDLEDRQERVGGLVAMMLGLGYTIAAASPFVLGAVRDATGTFEGPLWATVGCLGALIVWVAILGNVRRDPTV